MLIYIIYINMYNLEKCSNRDIGTIPKKKKLTLAALFSGNTPKPKPKPKKKKK